MGQAAAGSSSKVVKQTPGKPFKVKGDSFERFIFVAF
jgi:hypothetical protein